MKCIIIEDERPAQKLLKNYIERYPKLKLIAMYTSALDVDMGMIASCDLLFLDIKLPHISGLSFLQTLPVKPEVIITTAFANYALEAFELEMTDYLLKPFNFERFFKAVSKAENQFQLKNKQKEGKTERTFFFIYADKTFSRIDRDDILFIKSDDDYITIHTSHKKWLLNDTLKRWTHKLPNNIFVKVHQSYLINKSKIDTVKGNQVLIGAHTIPISRSHKKSFLDQLSDYL
ncbi:LytR/AlgR family response regulator transcription factor [Aquimarina hainanensis]|uniref:LytR/AlgR family response regulator transcription factor n=1 Tax=Aquimarina hainanensis TaxID=1578017 RepID=A0ABW5NBI2_9FLAO